MLNVDPAIKAQLASGEIRGFSLVEIILDGVPLRWTDCDVPIAWAGNLYLPLGYALGEVVYSTARIVDSVTLAIANSADALTAPFVGGNPQGSPVSIRFVALDSNYTLLGTYPDDHVVLFFGTIDDWGLPEGPLEITVVSDTVQWAQRTMRMQSSSCSWRMFRGPECGYTGPETTCNRTYARCTALGNTDNFGGERWLPSIEGANIWWGQTPAGGR